MRHMQYLLGANWELNLDFRNFVLHFGEEPVIKYGGGGLEEKWVFARQFLLHTWQWNSRRNIHFNRHYSKLMLFPFHSRISSEDANMRRGHTNERSVARSTGPQRSVSMSAQSGRKTWRTLGKSSNSTPLATKHSKVRASIKEGLYEKARVNWMILTTTCHNRLKTYRGFIPVTTPRNAGESWR